MLRTNCITAGFPLAGFSEALWSGVWTNANTDLLNCHRTFGAPYVYQAVFLKIGCNGILKSELIYFYWSNVYLYVI